MGKKPGFYPLRTSEPSDKKNASPDILLPAEPMD
jgi:hypothetical protein